MGITMKNSNIDERVLALGVEIEVKYFLSRLA